MPSTDRREGKRAMKALRTVIAQEADPHIPGMYEEQLGTLKHLHHYLLGLEACAVAETIQHN
jgi:hypothetical protein